MAPSAMAAQAQSMRGVPVMAAGVDPTFWGQNYDLTADSSPISPSLGLHHSPATSHTTQESLNGGTPPVQSPPSENARQNATNGGAKNNQKDSNGTQTRASVAVACVQCRIRHLKCDGGVRCSRCRTDNVECTYVKSRRGWKGKRKNKDDNGVSVPTNGAPSLSLALALLTKTQEYRSLKFLSTMAICLHPSSLTMAN